MHGREDQAMAFEHLPIGQVAPKFCLMENSTFYPDIILDMCQGQNIWLPTEQPADKMYLCGWKFNLSWATGQQLMASMIISNKTAGHIMKAALQVLFLLKHLQQKLSCHEILGNM